MLFWLPCRHEQQQEPEPASSAAPLNTSRQSILPPRQWMDNVHHRDYEEEDDTIRDDIEHDDSHDQSSLYASPSSVRYGRNNNHGFTSWKDRQAQFLQDTSFTRGFLSTDPNSSWQLEEGNENKNKNNTPYDFDPIMAEGDISLQEDADGAPHILALVNDTGGLNVSAISSSHHHQRDLSSLHSLADTMEDETEDDDIQMISKDRISLYLMKVT